MILATRRGLFVDIASYSTGAAVTAIAAVVIGGGTTLNYITGSDEVRYAVARVRFVVVLPSLLAAALVTTIVVSLLGGLSVPGVLLGGLFIAFNNLGELASAELQRQLDTPAILVATLGGRGLTLLVAILGAWFSVAMAVGAVSTCVALLVRARLATSSGGVTRSWGTSLKLAYNSRTLTLALSDAANMKAPFIASPLVVSSAVGAGQYSSLVSAQQSVLGVLTAPLYSAMANASAVGRQSWARRFELLFLLAASIAAIAGILAGPFLMDLLGVPRARTLWWTLLLLAVPVAVAARMLQYRMMAEQELTRASLLATVTASVSIGWSLLSALTHEDVLAAAPLAGEFAGFAFGLVSRLRRTRNA